MPTYTPISSANRSFTSAATRRQKRAKSRPLILMIGLVVMGIFGWFGWQYVQAEAVAQQPAMNAGAIEEQLQLVAQKYDDLSVSAVLLDIKSGSMASIHATDPFTAASTTKSVVACLYLSQVESGQRQLTDKVGGYPASYQLQQLIKQSNNQSWTALRDAVGRENEQAYADNLGLVSYRVADNTINASDLAVLLKQIWQQKLLNKQDTQMLLSWMQGTYEERFIPSGLPPDAVLYHKAGTLEDNVHEAALVTYHGRTYAWVIMSSADGVMDYDRRQVFYQDLNQAVFGLL